MDKNQLVISLVKTENRNGGRQYYLKTNQQKASSDLIELIWLKCEGVNTLPTWSTDRYYTFVNEFKEILHGLVEENHLRKGDSINYKMQFNQEFFITGKITNRNTKSEIVEIQSVFYVPLTSEDIRFFKVLMLDMNEIFRS